MPRRPTLPTLVLSTALIALPAWANDSTIGDDNGTIRFLDNADVSMEREYLRISPWSVSVDYLFRNTGMTDQTVTMAFPMPPMHFDEADHDLLTDFRLWVDDQPVKTTRKMVVQLDDGSDITAKALALGWNTDRLEQLLGGEIEDDNTLPAEWFDAEGTARFTISEFYVWRQTFPAGKAVAIRHTYTPSVESSVPIPFASFDSDTDFIKSKCIDAKTLRAIKTRSSGDGVNWSAVRYILLTARNWKGPIKDFTLSIQKAAPTDVVSLCFDGELKKTDPVTFQFHQKDFVPKADLDVLFVAAPQ